MCEGARSIVETFHYCFHISKVIRMNSHARSALAVAQRRLVMMIIDKCVILIDIENYESTKLVKCT